MTSPPFRFETIMHLVCTGYVAAEDIRDPARRFYPATGLLLELPTASGQPIELVVAAPDDLVAFADMQALTVLQPVCLPLQVVSVTADGRINARLRDDAVGRRLANAILGAIASVRHPATAGVLKPATSKGES